MRELTGHRVNPANNQIVAYVIDEPGRGGACHSYQIELPSHPHGNGMRLRLEFQNGPIGDAGVNGITHEVLIAILIDRLEGFQNGPFAHRYNAAALDHLRLAQAALHDRTRERMERDVEGTHTV